MTPGNSDNPAALAAVLAEARELTGAMEGIIARLDKAEADERESRALAEAAKAEAEVAETAAAAAGKEAGRLAKRNLWLIIGTAAAALLLFTVVGAAIAVTALSVADSNSARLRADSAHMASDRAKAVAQCEDINKTRAENRELWTLDAGLDAAQSATPAQRATAKVILAKAAGDFTLEDCSKLAS